MRVETPQFIITGCKWNLSTDKTIAARSTAPVRSGIESIALICKTHGPHLCERLNIDTADAGKHCTATAANDVTPDTTVCRATTQVTAVAPPPPPPPVGPPLTGVSAIPTLSQWGFLAMILSFGLLSGATLKKRKR
jgi:hypothetical protein